MKFVFARRELTSMPILMAAQALMIEAETLILAYSSEAKVPVPFPRRGQLCR
jgi:hypothetical protein